FGRCSERLYVAHETSFNEDTRGWPTQGGRCAKARPGRGCRGARARTARQNCPRTRGCPRKNCSFRLTWSLPPHSPAGALAGPSLHGPTPALSVQRGTGETHTAKALRALYVRTAA